MIDPTGVTSWEARQVADACTVKNAQVALEYETAPSQAPAQDATCAMAVRNVELNSSAMALSAEIDGERLVADLSVHHHADEVVGTIASPHNCL
jgi:hypothetical protein